MVVCRRFHQTCSRFACKAEEKFFVETLIDGAAVLNKVLPKFLKVRKRQCCKSAACHSHVTGWRNVKKINSWCQMVSRPWVQTSFQHLLLWLFLSGHKDCTTQSLRGKHHLHSLLGCWRVWKLSSLNLGSSASRSSSGPLNSRSGCRSSSRGCRWLI